VFSRATSRIFFAHDFAHGGCKFPFQGAKNAAQDHPTQSQGGDEKENRHARKTASRNYRETARGFDQPTQDVYSAKTRTGTNAARDGASQNAFTAHGTS